ncbi:MAG: gamma-glutamyltransferase [Gaiellaceae bacterium]
MSKRGAQIGLPAGVAGGHPATVDAGIEILREGGTAADAAVAACFASCVAESVMTGLLGGGHALVWDARERRALHLDFFVAAPGLGAIPRERRLRPIEVPFGEELVEYAIGPASCAVPGVPAGMHELWLRFGSLPWPRLLEPAKRLARDGVSMPPNHAACLDMLAPVMTLDAGERIYSPQGRLLQPGDVLLQPGIAAALEILAEDRQSLAHGELASSLLTLMSERDGAVTVGDLRSYRALWREPLATPYAGTRFLTRGGLAPIGPVLAALPRLAPLASRERVVVLTSALRDEGPETHTTNLVTVDSDGNACVLTTSLGLGSGDYVPGFDLHLNSMLGEVDLLVGPLEPGARMQSMTAPSLAVDRAGPTLAIGAAGGTRLRTALVSVAASMLDEGLEPQAAVDRPRIHPAGDMLNAEQGVDEEGLAELEAAGWQVRRWRGLHHYFGGVSVVGRAGAAGDPRRDGAGVLLSSG